MNTYQSKSAQASDELPARVCTNSSLRVGTMILLTTLALAATFSAEANSCQQSCRASWNQCRIQNKGSPSCDGQLQSCMQACIPRR
jgi:hypothetical protein